MTMQMPTGPMPAFAPDQDETAQPTDRKRRIAALLRALQAARPQGSDQEPGPATYAPGSTT